MRMREGRGGAAPIAERIEVPDTEDKELVLAFKRGEDGSYQDIYDRHSRRVHGICHRMLSNKQDAEEAAQETFLRIYTALGKFNGRYQLGAWIARITTNVCLDHIRAKSRKPADSVVIDEAIETSMRLTISDDDPESIHIRKSEGRRIRRVLDDLTPTHRAAIVLRDFEGFSYADIALALNMSEPQVKALLHRARVNFRKSWSTQGIAALLPWNLVARLRRTDFPDSSPDAAVAAGQAAHLAGPISNVAANCSAALQQCGQAFSERFATVFTAVVVSSAAVTSSVASAEPPPEPARKTVTDTVVAEDEETRVKKIGTRKRTPRTSSAPTVSVPAPEPSQEPATEPAPEPSPTSTPKEKEPQPQPTRPPLSPALGWETIIPIPRTTPVSNVVNLDCVLRTLTQTLETGIFHRGTTYPARLELSVATGVDFDLMVEKDGQEYWYDGGASGVTASGSGRSVNWSAGGTYSAMGRIDESDNPLPLYGRFDLQLSIDCSASVLFDEKLSLTAD